MPTLIPPDGEVKLCRNVPIDSTYKQTLMFIDQTAQYNYFNSKVFYSISNVSYTRLGRNSIKVQGQADSLLTCNYMMYRNTSFSNKWFYAFVDRVEYISNTVASVYYTIDLFQTWWFDMQLKPCLVEREHASHDILGDNTVPENLELGEYLYSQYDDGEGHKPGHIWGAYSIVFYTTFTATYDGSQWSFNRSTGGGNVNDNIFTGLNIYGFDIYGTGGNSAGGFIAAANNAGLLPDGIMCAVMCPTEIYMKNKPMAGGGYWPDHIDVRAPFITAFGNYIPKNNKLLTYPYCFGEIYSTDGVTGVFPQEFFNLQDGFTFVVEYTSTAAPTARITPTNYKGLAKPISESIYMDRFTQCSFNIDMFKAYLAQSLSAKIGMNVADDIDKFLGTNISNYLTDGQNMMNLSEKLGGAMIGLGTGLKVGGAIMKIEDTVSGISPQDKLFPVSGDQLSKAGDDVFKAYKTLGKVYEHAIQPAHNVGANTPDLNVALADKGFHLYYRTIKPEMAKRVDDYFSRYGYALGQVKIPNTWVRTRWTYTKTVDCEVEGNIPNDMRKGIESIFNNGIAMWADHTNVGNYTLDNPILY